MNRFDYGFSAFHKLPPLCNPKSAIRNRSIPQSAFQYRRYNHWYGSRRAYSRLGRDYALSQKMLWPRFLRWAEEQGGVEEIDRWSTPITEPQTTLETLAILDDAYRGVEEYLLQAGQTSAEIARLKSILT